MSSEYTVIVDAGFTETPGVATSLSATAGTGSISVSWARPLNSRFFIGHNGYGPAGELHENAISPVYRYDIRYRRAEVGGIAPGRWKQVSAYPWWVDRDSHPHRKTLNGLEDRLPYDVEIRAVNAVGPGSWSRVVSALTVN